MSSAAAASQSRTTETTEKETAKRSQLVTSDGVIEAAAAARIRDEHLGWEQPVLERRARGVRIDVHVNSNFVTEWLDAGR